MGGIKVVVPRLRCIHGRYFWRPTKAVKQIGFANVPLGSDLVNAIQEARRLKRTPSDVPDTRDQIIPSLDCPIVEAEGVAKKPRSNPTLIAFVRALDRKAAREWLKKLTRRS